MADKKKRCMTDLDPEIVSQVADLRAAEERSESQMIAILVREALAAREAKAKAPAA